VEETIVAYLKAGFQYLPEDDEENYVNPVSGAAVCYLGFEP
jgi:hypothetical protein